MAEWSGPGDSADGSPDQTPQDQVESAQHNASSGIAGEHADASGGETAKVLTFRRGEESAADAGDEELVDLDELDVPVDLAALQADDALLDALGGTNPDIPVRDEDEAPDLEALLVAWRRDVDAAPIGDLIDIDAAVAAIAEGRRPRRLRRRHLVPVATAAAVLMITFTGVGLAARDALPGDMLWGVAQVLYSDHARVVQAATSARIELANANAAFLQGDRIAAEAALQRAQEQMQEVDAQHGLKQLQAARESLAAKFQEDDSSSSLSWTSVSSSRSWNTSSSTPPTPSSLPLAHPPVTSAPSGPPSSSEPSTQPTSSPSSSSDSSDHPTSSGSSGGLFGGSHS